jgi:inorganic triphosphatase YgiF
MSNGHEVEAKFDADDADLSALHNLDRLGSFTVVSRRVVEQDDQYFDSDDERLAAAHSSLRIRVTPNGAVMTFKGARERSASADEQHVASRLEDEVALDTGVAEELVGEATRLMRSDLPPLVRARELTGECALHGTARLQNRRMVIVLEDDAQQAIEMAVDTCTGTRLSDGRVTRFREIELETKGASRETLMMAAQELMACVPGLRPNLRTKLERTLR